MNTRAPKILLLVCVVLGSATWFFQSRKNVMGRPRYIFINETEHHEHDTALKLSLKLAEGKSGIENTLILLRKLPEGTTIEKTAVDLFERWAVGKSRAGKGILYLYSEEENLFKIEVSYALEGIFPDVFCHRLEEGARTFMLSEIPQDFLSELLITMNIQGQDHRAEWTNSDAGSPAWFSAKSLSGGAGVTAKGYRRGLADYLSAIRTLSSEDVKLFQPSPDPEETLRLYLKSLDMGLGEPQLPLLTEGSQVFRFIVPRNKAQQRRVLDYYERALPHRLFLKDDLGVATFQPGVANLPIVLRRSRDLRWFVDEPKAWTYFHRFEKNNDFFLKYGDMPLVSALQRAKYPHAEKPVYEGRIPTPKPPSYPYSLAQLVTSLENKIKSYPEDHANYGQLGEIYLFEMNWQAKSIDAFERAKALSPSNLGYRWRLYDLYLNHSDVEKMIEQLKFLSQALPQDEEVQRWYTYYTHLYAFPPGEF